MTNFKKKYSFDKRSAEAKRILDKYPDRIPVIVELAKNTDLPPLDKNKYLVPYDLSVSQFIYVIRKRIKLPSEKALYIFVKNTLPVSSKLMSELYKENKSKCGFLYMDVSSESTFG